ncbi:hypothetical protein VPH35_102445 [Triticum aestivum]
MLQTMQTTQRYAAYWQGSLYVCQHELLMRHNILTHTLLSYKHNLIMSIDLPKGCNVGLFDNFYIGKSEKGVYCSLLYGFDGLHYGYDGYGLQVWLLDESCCQAKWMLKRDINLKPLLADFPWKNDNRPWTFQYGNEFDWSFDYYEPQDSGYTPFRYAISLLGFHPNEEVVFFHTPSKRVVAYNFECSKIEDLGYFPPERHHEIRMSFPYTPCQTGDLSSN